MKKLSLKGGWRDVWGHMRSAEVGNSAVTVGVERKAWKQNCHQRGLYRTWMMRKLGLLVWVIR